MTETKTDPSRRALVGGLSADMVAALGSAAGAQEQVAQGRGQVDNALAGLHTLTEDVTAIDRQ